MSNVVEQFFIPTLQVYTFDFDVARLAAVSGLTDSQGNPVIRDGTYRLFQAPRDLIILDAVVQVKETVATWDGNANGLCTLGPETSCPTLLTNGATQIPPSFFVNTGITFPDSSYNFASGSGFGTGPNAIKKDEYFSWIQTGSNGTRGLMQGKVTIRLICLDI